MSNHAKYTPPAYHELKFNCPHCGAYTGHEWGTILSSYRINEKQIIHSPATVTLSECLYCEKSCLWLDEKLVIPDYHGMPPNDDLSDDIKKIYEEAGGISKKSPRAASAMLRLALQMLCKNLGGEGKNIYDDIQELFEKGKVSAEVKESMDAVRKAGNEAAHPGVIDFNENPDIADMLFELINFIADETLTKPRERQQKLDKIRALTNKSTEQED